MTIADFGNFSIWVQKQIGKTVSLDGLKERLTGLSTPTAVAEQAAAFMRESAPWFDWQDKSPASTHLPWEYARAVEEALNRVAPANTPAASSASDVVGIKGNTKAWKESIKRSAMSAGSGRFKWDGDALVWNVLRAAWEDLIKNYPRAASDLELTSATRAV